MKHIIDPLDLSVEELDSYLDLADRIFANPEKYAHVCDGKKLATLFYEPSTRTRLSFVVYGRSIVIDTILGYKLHLYVFCDIISGKK